MRKLLALLAAACIAVTGTPRSEAAVSVDFFYTSLDPYGGWIETPDYGYVWQPSDLAEDWRPYTVGSWAYTDAGWTWVSEEPHGWVTHHYGRWLLVEDAGWVWVPDTEWAPAWVSWRRSTTHVGWAPLPPEARFERSVGIKTWSDSYYDIGPTYYSFVEVRNIGAPRLATVVLPPQENITIIRETQNITNIVVQNNIIINEGPKYDVIVRESAQPIRRLRLERQTDFVISEGNRGERHGRIEGDVFRVPAPEVQIAADVRPPKVQRRLERASVNRGWKGLEQRPEAKELRAKMQKETAVPAGLPPEPKFERMAERAKRQRGPQDSTALPDDAAKPAGDQPVVGTEGEMRDRDRAKRRAAKTNTAEDAAAAAGTEAATTPDAAAPGNRENRRERMKRGGEAGAPDATPGQPADPVTPDAAKPGATTPDATTPDANPADRQGRRMRERERAGAKTESTPDAPQPPAAAAGDEQPGADAKKQRDAAGKAKMEADDAAKARAGAEDAARDEAKTKREAGDAAKSEAKAPREAATEKPKTEAASDEQKQPRGAGEARGRREGQSDEKPAGDAASPATNTGNPAGSSNRRSAAERMERSPGAQAPGAGEPRERANRPERSERPERAERPDRPAASERPDRPKSAANDRPNRPERPQGGGGAPGAERPNGGNGGGGGAAEANRSGGNGGGNPNERRGGAPE